MGMKLKRIFALITIFTLSACSAPNHINSISEKDSSSSQVVNESSAISGSSSVISSSSSESSSVHEHTFSNIWFYDDANHWHKSTCGHNVVSDKASHIFRDTVIEPTYSTGGYTKHACTICGYSCTDSYTEQLQHQYAGTWSYNEFVHWHACTDSGYEHLKADESVHTFNDVITDPTYDAGGYTTHTCTVCGYSYRDNETDRLKYRISFDLSGGTSSTLVNNQEVHSFDEIIFTLDCVKDNYNFRGWSYNGTKVVDQFGNRISVPQLTGNMTFVAVFMQDVNMVISNTNPTAGNVTGEGYYPFNTYVEIKASPNDGYYFAGWYYEDILISNQETYKYMMWNQDVTIEARWGLIEYSITYNLNGGTNSSRNPSKYTVENKITLYKASKTGHSFSCWKIENKVITTIDKGTTGDLTLDAYYDINSYTITVSSSDNSKGSVFGGGTYAYNSQITITAIPKEYCQFDGWYFDNNLVSTDESYTFNVPAKNVTFLAEFSLRTYQLHVESKHPLLGTIMVKGDSDYQTESDKDVKYQDSVVVSAYTTTQEYNFLGWYDSNDDLIATSPVYSFAMPHSNYNIYAKWNAPSFNFNVISYDLTKGTVSQSDGAYEYNSVVTVSATPLEGYVFKCWYHESTIVSGDAMYDFKMPFNDYSLVAHFVKKTEAEKLGIIPVIDFVNMTITYGLYPQKNINDSSLLAALNEISAPESNGWYLYNNEYYAKTSATPYGSNYVFDNGTTIVDGTTYWFKCEPITWKILTENNGEYYLLSTVLLDVHRFHKDINNYKWSDIRSWLNGDFYNSAFALNNRYILTTIVDNSAATTHSASNSYACQDTQDKIFLPSYQDYINSNYGFLTSIDSTDTRCCKTTDWARARGAGSSAKTNYGLYWTRSPSDTYYSKYVWTVTSSGNMTVKYTYESNVSVRPSLSFKVS